MRKDRNNMTIDEIIEQIPTEEITLPQFVLINGEYLPLEETVRKSIIISNPATGALTFEPKIAYAITMALMEKSKEITDKYTKFENQKDTENFSEKVLDIIFEQYFDVMEMISAEETEKANKAFLPLGLSKGEYFEIFQNKMMNTQIQAPDASPEARRILELICYALKSGKPNFKKSNTELAELFGVTDRQKLRDRIIEAANEVTNMHISEFELKGKAKSTVYIGNIANCIVEQDNATKACTLFVSISKDLIKLLHSEDDDMYFFSLTMHTNDLQLPQRNGRDVLPLLSYIRTAYRQNGKKPISAATAFTLLYGKPIEEYRKPKEKITEFREKLLHIQAQYGISWSYCDYYGRLYPTSWKPISRGEINESYILFDLPPAPTDELAESCERSRIAAQKKRRKK